MTAIIILLVVLILLVLALIVVTLRRRSIEPKDIEKSLSTSWMKLGLDRTIGAIETQAKEIKDSYRSFEQMLRVPVERASFGELSLEAILSDQLPPGTYGIRERILDGRYPDAHITSTAGLICIDSKFPLDNYRNMLQTEDQAEKLRLKAQFIRQDVRTHLDKIATDYVCPEKGSAEFAFAYIPSEAVYYFLVNEAFDMLRDYTGKGVQVVSPLTLCHKIELIRAGVHAKKLSQDAEMVRNDLLNLTKKFATIDELWRVFYRTHLRNLEGKASELDEAYKKLRDEFERISAMPEDRS